MGAKPVLKDAPINWVELKTSACINNDKDLFKYERKLKKFWIQSFLLGVPKIIVGFRTQNGILDHLEELETKTIPGLVKRKGKGSWDGNVCINFAAAFLECEYVSTLLPMILTIQGSPLISLRKVYGASSVQIEVKQSSWND